MSTHVMRHRSPSLTAAVLSPRLLVISAFWAGLQTFWVGFDSVRSMVGSSVRIPLAFIHDALDVFNMEQHPGAFLSARPPFLIAEGLPYHGFASESGNVCRKSQGGQMDVLSEVLKVVKL